MFILIRRYKRSRFNERQVEQIADYAKDLSLFFLGTVIAPIFADIDTIEPIVILLGLLISSMFFTLSMLLLKG